MKKEELIVLMKYLLICLQAAELKDCSAEAPAPE